MKVSSNIISGFSILWLVGLMVLANQLKVIHEMQLVNHEVSEINVISATTVLQMKESATLLTDNTKRFFATFDPTYAANIEEFRNDFLEQLAELRKRVRSDGERAETENLSVAFDDYWKAFNRLKAQNQSFDPDDLPPDFIRAIGHLEGQTDVVLDAVLFSIKQQVATAEATGQRAERISWIAGIFSLLLGVIVAAVIVGKINEPLHRLTKGTRAIAPVDRSKLRQTAQQTAPVTPRMSATVSESSEAPAKGGIPIWVWIVVALAVLAAVAYFMMNRK